MSLKDWPINPNIKVRDQRRPQPKKDETPDFLTRLYNAFSEKITSSINPNVYYENERQWEQEMNTRHDIEESQRRWEEARRNGTLPRFLDRRRD